MDEPTERMIAACRRKKVFLSQEAAEAELEQIRAAARRGNQRRREQRAYPCLVCFRWHLTSQPVQSSGARALKEAKQIEENEALLRTWKPPS